MKFLSMTLFAVAIFTAGPVISTPASPSVLAKRQLVDCMNKQMTLSKTISYNEATKVCKEIIKSQNTGLVASNEPKSAR